MQLKENIANTLGKILHSDANRISWEDIQRVRSAPSDEKDMIVGEIDEKLRERDKKGLTSDEYETLFGKK